MQINEKNGTTDGKTPSFFEALKNGTAKTFAQIHKSNPFMESLQATNDSKAYSDAENALQPQSFAKSIKPIKGILSAFIASYPFVSVITGGAVAYFTAELLAASFVGAWNTTILAMFTALLTVLVAINEYAKSFAFKMVFLQKIQSYVFLALATLIISIAISVGGGYLINKKANEVLVLESIELDAQNENDSIRAYYLESIESQKSIIEANQKVLDNPKKPQYQKNYSTDAIQKAQTEKANIEAKMESLLTDATARAQDSTQKAQIDSQNKGYIVSIIITLLELFYVLFFFLHSKILFDIKTENANFEVVKPVNAPVATDAMVLPSFEDLGKIMLLERLGLNTFLPQNIVQNTDASPNKTGFQFNSNNDPVNNDPVHNKNTTTNPYNEPVHGKNGNSFGIDICEHCGEKFQRKTHNQRFCKEECRIASWEKRTGKTFKKGKSNGFNAIMVQLLLLAAMYPAPSNSFFFGLYIALHGIVGIQIIAWAYSKIKKGRIPKFPKNFTPTKETTKETLKEYYKSNSK